MAGVIDVVVEGIATVPAPAAPEIVPLEPATVVPDELLPVDEAPDVPLDVVVPAPASAVPAVAAAAAAVAAAVASLALAAVAAEEAALAGAEALSAAADAAWPEG